MAFQDFLCKYVKFSAWTQAKTASSLIGVTPAICEAYRKLANRSRDVCYSISNGVFTERFPHDNRQSIRNENGWDDSKTVFIMPNGFGPWHGLNKLIEAFALLSPECRAKIHCVLPGNGEMFDEIKSRICELGLEECIELPGQLGRDEIYSILTAADVGLFLCMEPGKLAYPGSPLKLFEYFGAGLPVITCSDSYHSKMIPYYSLGIVLESNTPESLSQAIAKFANESAPFFDRENILKIAKDEFHWQIVSRRVLAVLHNTEPVLEKWLIHDSELSN